ncbi:hypothetical protein [Amycolatopsis sp. CA-230715]|uniref:hypothetical protein n=1 Tax=Amycolatopsis sp. CA-230715 TaxID=2745196 RepID=UPI001C0397BE|nr:hypothetical protein [Amycolatopsis sp. CA-230715]QWF77819.1 hypothetical protein HUW46_01212 [Amycolatopsis sp. CA-230715]
MGWQEAHRYYAALREVERELDRTADGAVPWRAEYAEIFGDRRGLLLALRRRWDLMVQAQVEPDGAPRLRELAQEHPGLARVVCLDGAAPARCPLGGVA